MKIKSFLLFLGRRPHICQSSRSDRRDGDVMALDQWWRHPARASTASRARHCKRVANANVRWSNVYYAEPTEAWTSTLFSEI